MAVAARAATEAEGLSAARVETAEMAAKDRTGQDAAAAADAVDAAESVGSEEEEEEERRSLSTLQPPGRFHRWTSIFL